ncbi:unnamed protein product [Acanthoscelides obtectus]|uniref:Uncharacterized protein n=1 Tax=Acanthoscelides obtectus TaxID=200917 RepID=A0A9P0KHP7_ACAOB|nr:unnamed protein product [Acanthoscelides obtectus]CAK1660915.1 Follicle cell protein 3C-1 [Acanthoscelides obtectus]
MSKVQLAYILICVVFGTRADEVPSSVDIHQGAVGLPRTDIHVADITTKVEDTPVKPEDSPSVQGHAVVTEKSEHPKIETRVLEAETIAAQEKSDVTTSEDAKTEQVQPAKMEARILTNHITVDGDLMGLTNEKAEEVEEGPVPCTCGVFLSGQFKKGHKTEPKGEPILMQEMDAPFANNAVGSRQCTSKCIETVR